MLIVAAAAPGTVAQVCEDLDNDGFFATANCGTAKDCNDANAAIHPGATEACNALDDDCNGLTDDDPACDRTCDNPEVLLPVTDVTPDPLDRSSWPDAVWVGDGWVVGWEMAITEPDCTELLLQKIRPDGTLDGGPVSVSGGGAAENVFVTEAQLAWTGTQLAVTWLEAALQHVCDGLQPGAIKTQFRLYDSSLNPVTAGTELGCGLNGHDENDVGWSGRRFGLFWQTIDTAYFAPADTNGIVTNSCGTTIDTYNDGGQDREAAWGDEYFGFFHSRDPDMAGMVAEIYFRRVGDDGFLPDPAAIRETFDPTRSLWPAAVWADGEWGVSWADDRAAPNTRWSDIYFMRLAADGTKLDPPGDVRVTCCNSDEEGGPDRELNDLAWTGEEYGLVYEEDNGPTGSTGDLFFQRIDSSGTTVGTPMLVTTDAERLARHPSLVWNGKEYAVFYTETAASPDRIQMRRIGCNCTDVDNDLFSSCAGGDCNDDDPMIHPLAAEACLDGQDNNCDGAADCQDLAACPPGGGSPPGAVSGLLFGADKETLSWSPKPSADVYDLLTGDLDDLLADADYARSRCLAVRVSGTSHADPSTPFPGEGLYYLVRAKTDPCLLGTWGSGLRDEAQLTCP